jgi:hypothetical protein
MMSGAGDAVRCAVAVAVDGMLRLATLAQELIDAVCGLTNGLHKYANPYLNQFFSYI